MSNDTPDPTLPKPSALIDRPWFWRALWLALATAYGAVALVGKTAWDANQKVNELREQSRKDAASDTAKELTGYVTTAEWLKWQIQFEREQTTRDDRIVQRLRSLR